MRYDYKVKTCLRCECDFKPSSGVQQYCSPCKPLRDKEKRGEYRDNNRTDLRRKQRDRWRTHNSQTRNSKLKSKYGITLAQYWDHVVRQNGNCLICRKPRKLVVDHCHRRDQFRGLLCQSCNTGLGYFDDYPPSLLRALIYLCQTDDLKVRDAVEVLENGLSRNIDGKAVEGLTRVLFDTVLLDSWAFAPPRGDQ